MKKKVLIVDDEQDILTSVAMLIDSMGYESKKLTKMFKETKGLEKFVLEACLARYSRTTS